MLVADISRPCMFISINLSLQADLFDPRRWESTYDLNFIKLA